MNLLWLLIYIYILDFIGSFIKVGIAWERGEIVERRTWEYYVISAVIDLLFITIIWYAMNG